MDCEKIRLCPFYNNFMPNMPENSEEMKQKFCKGDKTQCARYFAINNMGFMPEGLFPDKLEEVKKIFNKKMNGK